MLSCIVDTEHTSAESTKTLILTMHVHVFCNIENHSMNYRLRDATCQMSTAPIQNGHTKRAVTPKQFNLVVPVKRCSLVDMQHRKNCAFGDAGVKVGMHLDIAVGTSAFPNGSENVAIFKHVQNFTQCTGAFTHKPPKAQSPHMCRKSSIV